MISVHLQEFPRNFSLTSDGKLVEEMSKVRAICSTILSMRKDHNIKVRIPLASVVLHGEKLDFLGKYRDIILSETNIKNLLFDGDISKVGSEVLQINFKNLGPKIGKGVQQVLQAHKAGEFSKNADGAILIAGFVIEKCDFSIAFKAKEGTEVRFCHEAGCAIDLDINVTEDLKNEGIMRDFVRLVQQDRKFANFEILDKIHISCEISDAKVQSILESYRDYILAQCLAADLEFNAKTPTGTRYSHELYDLEIAIFLRKYV